METRTIAALEKPDNFMKFIFNLARMEKRQEGDIVDGS
jgi:hypothetical protein